MKIKVTIKISILQRNVAGFAGKLTANSIYSRQMTDSKRAIVLLSGGLDSATCLAIARSQGLSVYALSFSYSQKHSAELQCAKFLAQHYQVAEHKIITLDPSVFSGSSLVDKEMNIPKARDLSEMPLGIPSTYVPCRNALFLTYALAWAEVTKTNSIYIGVNALDYSGYPDCRPEFIAAFENMANLASKISTEGGQKVHIEAPLQNLTKAEIAKLALELSVPVEHTLSCYDPTSDGKPCNECDACILRAKGFESLI